MDSSTHSALTARMPLARAYSRSVLGPGNHDDRAKAMIAHSLTANLNSYTDAVDFEFTFINFFSGSDIKTKLKFFIDGRNQPGSITASCTCHGRLQFCDHVLAGMAMIDNHLKAVKPTPPDPLEKWRTWTAAAKNSLQSHDAPVAKATLPKDVLQLDVSVEPAYGRLSVIPLAGRSNRLSPKGNPPTPVKYSQAGNLSMQFDESVPIPLRIAMTSLALQSGYESTYVNTPFNLDAVRQLIDAGIAHTDNMKPLRWGPQQTVRFQWEYSQDDDNYTLVPASDQGIPPKALEWVCGGRIGYLDVDGGVIGFRTYQEPHLRASVPRAPRIPSAEFDEVFKLLAASKIFPLPRRRAKAGELSVHGKPVVELSHHKAKPRKNAKDSSSGRADGAVELKMRYGNYTVPLNPNEPAVEVETEDGKLVIIRDQTAEKEFLTRFEQAGLYALDTQPLHIPPEKVQFSAAPKGAPLLPGALAKKVTKVVEALNGVVELSENYPYQVVDADQLVYSSTDDGGPLLSIGCKVKVGEHYVDLVPAFKALLADPSFSMRPRAGEDPNAKIELPIDDGLTIRAPLSRVRELIEPIADIIEECGKAGIRISRAAAGILEMTEERPGVWAHNSSAQKLADAWETREQRPIPDLDWTMWDHQVVGFYWFGWLADCGIGGVLADEMGVGKSAQVVAHLLSEKQLGKLKHPALIVFTPNANGVWFREFAKRGKGLKAIPIRNSARKSMQDRLDAVKGADAILCTYGQLTRAMEFFKQLQFSICVPDEAHNAKGYTSQNAIALRELNARIIPTTGTPLENNLGELYTLVDLAAPGLLGTRRSFNKVFRNPIERLKDPDKIKLLRQRIKPLILRRLKKDVFKDMPPKQYVTVPVSLGPQQRELYEALRAAASAEVRAILKDQGNKAWKFQVLTVLMKLRQACASPKLIKGVAAAQRCTETAKEDAFAELLQDHINAGSKIIVSSLWPTFIDLLQQRSDAMGIPSFRIDGNTSIAARTDQENRFQAGERSLFYLSTKAGGTSITLTEADTVIHTTPWFNPKPEAQCEDRTHRGEQLKQVRVLRLVIGGSIEERILEMQESKNLLAASILDDDDGDSQAIEALSREDFINLLRPIDESMTLGEDSGQDQMPIDRESDDDADDDEAA